MKVDDPSVDPAARRVHGRVLSADATGAVLFDGARLRLRRATETLDPRQWQPGDLVDTSCVPDVIHRHPGTDYPVGSVDGQRLDGAHWARLKQRATAVAQTRRFFTESLGLLEVETPILVRSAGTEVHLDAVAATLTPRPGAQPEPRYLITSPEHHMKRLLAAGAPPIFQVSRVFRDGERGQNHRPEFTMLEWYRPWAGYEALMTDCERWLGDLLGPKLSYQGQTVDLEGPWPRLTFREALRERGGVADPDALSPDAQLEVLVDRVEPTLGRERPEFLTEYPIAMASLARPAPHDPSVAERFELYVAGLELGNAFGELTDAAEQRRRCEADNTERVALGRAPYPLDEDFLAALADGMPPSAGIAVGLDRVLMLLMDTDRIDDVLAF
ncbi:MAG: lysyl-tRNA synthetase class 2 [Myxococcota bacterium]|jgi:lysyl-tRNA synthetase class 2